jgi:trimethyllysine dioxygenase
MYTDEGLKHWLDTLETYGIAFVEGVPHEATEQLAHRISFLRETGNPPTDNASAHTDYTYLNEPPGLKMLHTTKGDEALFVDGFHVAQQLKSISPTAYRTLSSTRVPTHSDGYVPTPRAVLNHGPDDRLFQIRYNNNERSTLDHLSASQLDAFYDALFLWNDLVLKNEMRNVLRPGRVVMIDNWRVLHASQACGLYLPWDDYKSRLRTLRWTQQDKDRLL